MIRIVSLLIVCAVLAQAAPMRATFANDALPKTLGLTAMACGTATLAGMALNELAIHSPKAHKTVGIVLTVIAAVGVASMFGSIAMGGGK